MNNCITVCELYSMKRTQEFGSKIFKQKNYAAKMFPVFAA